MKVDDDDNDDDNLKKSRPFIFLNPPKFVIDCDRESWEDVHLLDVIHSHWRLLYKHFKRCTSRTFSALTKRASLGAHPFPSVLMYRVASTSDT